MGKEKYRKDILALFAKSPVVHISSIARIITAKKHVKQYVKRSVHYLIQQGKIQQLTKGWYTTRDDITLAVFCFQPAYFGLQDALSFHRLWEQETIPLIITTKKVRPGIRTVLGKNVLLRRLEQRYFFGIVYDHQHDAAVPYSDLEKTFIDFFYFRESLRDDVLSFFLKKLNRKKLNIYLNRYPKKFRERVFSSLTKH